MSLSQPRRGRLLIPTIIIALAAVLIMVVVTLQSGSSATESAEAAAAPAAGEVASPNLTVMELRDDRDLLSAGPVDAPVALIVFSDYQCSYCARWSNDTLPSMRQLADEGKLRIEWRDMNIFGADSARAALASYAAAQQGRYWEFHDALFANGEKRPASQLTEAALIETAASLSLNTERFAADMASPAAAAEIARNAQLGRDLGATSTPSFLLGGVPISGAQPTQIFLDTYAAVFANQARQ